MTSTSSRSTTSPARRHWPTYWITAIAVTLLFVVSLLAHELAHATLARRFGVRVKSITLWMLGGAAVFEDEPPTPTPRADALIAGIGPAMSAALSLLYLGAAALLDPAWLSGLPAAGLSWLAVVNLLLAGFNLLPAAPLDGGRLLRTWLWRRTGDRAAATAPTVGQTVGAALIGGGGVLAQAVADCPQWSRGCAGEAGVT